MRSSARRPSRYWSRQHPPVRHLPRAHVNLRHRGGVVRSGGPHGQHLLIMRTEVFGAAARSWEHGRRDAVPDRDPQPDVRRVSLVRLSALVAQAAASLGKLSVEGEVHRVQQGRSGRLWFTLRDRAAQISVSVPSSRRSRCRAVAGERVSVVGRLEWVNEWGQLQLVAEEVTPVGGGAIAAAMPRPGAGCRPTA